MDRKRRNSTVRQLELLVEFAEANMDLALGRLRSKEGRALSARLWQECADILNSEGPTRSPKEWTKVWNDLKSRVRSKLTSLTVSQRGTGGGPNVGESLSGLEDRVANIIGRDVGPIPNVAQDQLQASPEENPAVMVEYIDNVDMELQEPNEVITDDLPGPSSASLRLPPEQLRPRPTQSPPRPTQSPSPQPSGLSSRLERTPRQHRERPRQRQRTSRQSLTSRVHTQALTRQAALDESRAIIMRIEELRANTDNMLAQAALRQAEAARAQAEAAVISAQASRLQAQTWATFLNNLTPALQSYLTRNALRRATRRLSTSEDEN